MRGQQERSGALFSYVSIEARIPARHPLRQSRKLPREQLLLASLLQAFYGIRSER